jgi:hypothetical protein
MGLMDMVMGSGGNQAIPEIAQKLGIPESQAHSALGALLPALGGALQQNANSGGLESLLGMLGGAQPQQVLDNPGAVHAPETTDLGNNILGQLFGSKDVSRAVASRAAEQTGIGSDLMKQLLPVAATMLMGSLMKQNQGTPAQAFSGNAGSNDLMGCLASMLDQDRDGNPFNDLLGMAQKFIK